MILNNFVSELSLSSDLCSVSGSEDSHIVLSIPDGCEASCSKVSSNIVPDCGDTRVEGRAVTNTIYFILRMFATMALASVYIILDAQTIQMCKMEIASGGKGSYGRQILYKTLAQAIISPLVGLIMDQITAKTGTTNYVAPFVICDVMLVGALAALFMVGEDIGLPKSSDTMKGVKKIFGNFNILIFLIMVLVCGSMFGFVETFLFVFLKEDLNAPIYLLGLTITMGSLGKVVTKILKSTIMNICFSLNSFLILLGLYCWKDWCCQCIHLGSLHVRSQIYWIFLHTMCLVCLPF